MNELAGELEGRGVYLARWKTLDGSRVMYAVTSDGTKLDHIPIRGLVTYEIADRLLTAKLNHFDPKPALQLVRDEQPAIPSEKLPRGAFLALHGLIRRQSPPTG